MGKMQSHEVLAVTEACRKARKDSRHPDAICGLVEHDFMLYDTKPHTNAECSLQHLLQQQQQGRFWQIRLRGSQQQQAHKHC